MRRKLTLTSLALCAVAVVLTGQRESRAHHLDSTTWALTGTARLKIGRQRSAPAASQFALAVDATSHVVLTSSDVTFGGTYVDKGKRGFRLEPDEAAIDAVAEFLTNELAQTTGATGIVVEKTTIKVGGAVSRDGLTLSAKTKASIKGTATIDSRPVRGKVSVTGVYTGTKTG